MLLDGVRWIFSFTVGTHKPRESRSLPEILYIPLKFEND